MEARGRGEMRRNSRQTASGLRNGLLESALAVRRCYDERAARIVPATQFGVALQFFGGASSFPADGVQVRQIDTCLIKVDFAAASHDMEEKEGHAAPQQSKAGARSCLSAAGACRPPPVMSINAWRIARLQSAAAKPAFSSMRVSAGTFSPDCFMLFQPASAALPEWHVNLARLVVHERGAMVFFTERLRRGF
jgi:hypothetical protein